MSGAIDRIGVVITVTGMIKVYLAHNGVILKSFKSIEAFQKWKERRKAIIVSTTWE